MSASCCLGMSKAPPGIRGGAFEVRLQRARALVDLGRHKEAALDYMKAVTQSLEEDRLFSAAFYLKELTSLRLDREMFLEEYSRETDLWWRVRALQELGWDDERRQLLLENAETIEAEGNPLLTLELAWARADMREYIEVRKDVPDRTRDFRILTSDEECNEGEGVESEEE